MVRPWNKKEEAVGGFVPTEAPQQIQSIQQGEQSVEHTFQHILSGGQKNIGRLQPFRQNQLKEGGGV